MCWKEAEIASVTKTETDAFEREREGGRKRTTEAVAQVVADATRTDDGDERAGLGRNESEKDDEIGLCRRRRDSTERAGVP